MAIRSFCFKALGESLREHVHAARTLAAQRLTWLVGFLLIQPTFHFVTGAPLEALLWLGGLPAVSVATLAAMPDFRRKVKRRRTAKTREGMLERFSLVAAQLGKPSLERFSKQRERVNRIADLFSGEKEEAPVKPGEYLLWLYLKLLLVLDHLRELDRTSDVASIEAERERLRTGLASRELSPAARQSTMETLELLEQRLFAARQRITRMEEIGCDLVRIEHKIALLHDRAAQHSMLGEAGLRIDLASELAGFPHGSLSSTSQMEEMDAFFEAHLES